MGWFSRAPVLGNKNKGWLRGVLGALCNPCGENSTRRQACRAVGKVTSDGGSIPPTSTTIQRPTVLSWAFSFVDSARHAGLPAILRVPAARCLTATTRPVRPCSALSSLETYANFFAVALAEGVVHQPLVRVPTRMVASRVCTSNAERQTREASIHVSPWAGTGRHRSCCAHGSGRSALG